MEQIIFIRIGTGFYAISIDQTERFVKDAEILEVGDNEPSGICGMIRFNDEMIPVLNSYKWFGQEQTDMGDRTFFVIMTLDSKAFAFRISAVIECADVSEESCRNITSVCGQTNSGIFKEAVSREGKLYLKINAAAVLKKITAAAEISESLEKM